MNDIRSAASEVRAVIRRHASVADVELPDGLLLGSEGLGLDSVAIVELLLACENECGVRLEPNIFEGTAITVGLLVSAVERVRHQAS